MSEFLKWAERFGDLSIVMQIAVPIAVLLFLALYAFFLWAAGRIVGQEDLSYARSLGVSAIEFVVLLGVSYGLLSAVGGDTLRSLVQTQTQITFNAVYHLVSFAVLVGLLITLARVSPIRGMLIWAIRFVLLVHLGWFVTGTVFVANALFIGVQAPGAFGGPAFAFNLTLGILFLIAALSALVLWMAGVLAGAEKLSFPLALLLAWVKNGLLVALFFVAAAPIEAAFPETPPLNRLAFMGSVLIGLNFVLVIVGTRLLAGASFGRGIVLWLLEIPLWVLLGALVVGIDMVALSIIQTAQTPNGVKVLEFVTLGLMGAVVAALAIYFGGQLLTPAVGAPRRSAA
jgi:hypothetical protein